MFKPKSLSSLNEHDAKVLRDHLLLQNGLISTAMVIVSRTVDESEIKETKERLTYITSVMDLDFQERYGFDPNEYD